MEIKWTPTARLTYLEILEYLSKTWTVKEVEKFISKTEHTIDQITSTPYMFEASRRNKKVRKGFITEHNTLYYRIKLRKKEIELLTFWDNRQNPSKLKY